jgi:hypothetical protein
MSKQKQGNDSNQAPTRLVWKVPFELWTPLPLDACASRLQSVNQHQGILSEKHQLYLTSLGDSTRLFHLSEPGGWMASAWVVGRMEGLPEAGTSIQGNVGIAPRVLSAIGNLLCAAVVMLVSVAARSLPGFLVVAAIVGLVAIAYGSAIRSARSKLLHSVTRIFEADTL